jgi:NADH-quinone oxidoreductase subunit M
MGLLSLCHLAPDRLRRAAAGGRPRPQRRPPVRGLIALVGSVVSFLVTLPLISGFDTKTAALQFVEKQPWIDRFNVFYHLGVDGLSVWFVLLTAFIT